MYLALLVRLNADNVQCAKASEHATFKYNTVHRERDKTEVNAL